MQVMEIIVIHHQLIPTHISKGFLKLNTVKTTDKNDASIDLRSFASK